jgi:hypothetical protein
MALFMYQKTASGWYVGTEESLEAHGCQRMTDARTNPELKMSLLLSKDRMHHSVGWWRNAEYEYCWHLSMSAVSAHEYHRYTTFGLIPATEDIPREEMVYWGRVFFGEHAHKAWYEPGGTDPRLTRTEAHDRSKMHHLRVFLSPLSLRPIIPKGEVYHLTQWIDGLTPEKVDR